MYLYQCEGCIESIGCIYVSIMFETAVEVADDSNILGRRLNEYLSVVLITL